MPRRTDLPIYMIEAIIKYLEDYRRELDRRGINNIKLIPIRQKRVLKYHRVLHEKRNCGSVFGRIMKYLVENNLALIDNDRKGRYYIRREEVDDAIELLKKLKRRYTPRKRCREW